MTDYLSSMVTRAFAPATTVRPYLPSMFEPPAGAAATVPLDADPEPSDRHAPVTDVLAALERRPRDDSSNMVPPRSASDGVAAHGAIDDRRPLLAPLFQSHPDHIASARVDPTEAADEEPRSLRRPPATHVSPWSEKDLASTRADGAVIASRPPIRRAHTRVIDTVDPIDPAAAVAVAPPTTAPERIARTRTPHLGDRVALPAPTHEAAPRAAAPQPTREPEVTPEPARGGALSSLGVRPLIPAARIIPAPVATAPRMSEPTIHVTIGRVEVRATPPPAPSRPRAQITAPPVMTLEEYLRRRSSESR
jgi:hypothetical protein